MARAIHREPAHCIICTKDIPQDRNIKGSVTCSAECAEKRRKAQRTLQDDRECRYCSRPASREEREAYKRFRALERKRPDLLYPEGWAQFKAECEAQVGGIEPTPQAFARALADRAEAKESESEVTQ
jgi:hypothetical protein